MISGCSGAIVSITSEGSTIVFHGCIGVVNGPGSMGVTNDDAGSASCPSLRNAKWRASASTFRSPQCGHDHASAGICSPHESHVIIATASAGATVICPFAPGLRSVMGALEPPPQIEQPYIAQPKLTT